ncbi:Protein of unknown function, partial [Gryllus bimaculatus]
MKMYPDNLVGSGSLQIETKPGTWEGMSIKAPTSFKGGKSKRKKIKTTYFGFKYIKYSAINKWRKSTIILIYFFVFKTKTSGKSSILKEIYKWNIFLNIMTLYEIHLVGNMLNGFCCYTFEEENHYY